MKIGVLNIEAIPAGKVNIADDRVDTLQKMFKSAKKVYIQADSITEADKIHEADGIICPQDCKADLVLRDLEFVELRLERSSDEAEKKLFTQFKEILDQERFLSELELSAENKAMIQGYPMLTTKKIFFVPPDYASDKEKILFNAYAAFGYISFFTAGEKDSHAWSLPKGSNAWEAAGCIHSDIQKGFIRAEVVSYQDLINDNGLSAARANNHIRLETKSYEVRDGDYIVFRFNK